MKGPDLDVHMRPIEMLCLDCGAEGICFPTRKRKINGSQPHHGRLWCPNCTGKQHRLNFEISLQIERDELGLPRLYRRIT